MLIKEILSAESTHKLREAIEKKDFTIIQLNKDILSNIYYLEKLNQYLNNTLLVYPYVSVNNYKSTTSRRDLIERTKDKYENALKTELSIKNILYRLSKGDTLVLNKLQKFDRDIRQLAHLFSKLFSAETNVNLYYAYKETTGINLHFDYTDIFAIQIHGNKYWKIYKGEKGVTSKLVEHQKKPIIDSDFTDIVTKQGELLFIPKGMWHYAYTKESSSIHLSLSLKPLKVSTLIDFLINEEFNSFGEENIYDLSEEKIKNQLLELIEKLEAVIIDSNMIDKIKNSVIPKEYEIELE